MTHEEDYDYEEKLRNWFDEYEEKNLKFENLKDEEKFHPAWQVSAIMFLASKLKDQSEYFFLHGEHDELYIGSSFDIFHEFTEDDVRIAVHHSIRIEDYGFKIYASM